MTISPKLRLLGGFSLTDSSGAPVSLTLRKTEALIAYLASSEIKSQPREFLASLLWSESTQASALQSLRQARLSLLRDLAAHGLPIVEFNRRDVCLDVSALKIDIVRFMDLQVAGDEDSLARAADLYRGEFLAGLDVGSEPFNEWLRQTRDWYREQIELTLRRLLALQEQAGAWEPAIRTAKRLLALDPLREDLHRWLMRAFAAAGHRTSALAAYDACRSLLNEELGVAPDPETEALYRSILLRSDPAHAAAADAGFARTRGRDTRPAAVATLGRSAARRRPDPAAAPISHLSNAALSVLQVAAICADHFTRDLLDAIGERSASECEPELRELEARGLLHWDAERKRGKLHHEVRQKVLDRMLPSHRRHLHYAAAETLLLLDGSENSELGYEIAAHFRSAEKWTLAVTQQLKLARRETDAGRLESVEPMLRQALADLEKLPAGPPRGGLELSILLLQSYLAELRGDLDRAESILDALWPALKPDGDGEHWVAALLARSRLRSRQGQHRNAYAAIRQIAQTGKPAPMESVWLLPERFATSADLLTEESTSPAVAQLRRRADGCRAAKAEYAALQALGQAKQEKFASAYGFCREAVQQAEDLPDQTFLVASLQTLGIVQTWDGEAAAALPTLERALELAVGTGDLLRQYTSHGYCGFALMNAGRAHQAAEQLARALDMAEKMKLPFMAAMFTAWHAGALVESGEAERAVDVAHQAIRLASERNEPWARSVGLRFLGQALALAATKDSRLVDRILRSAQEIQSGLGLPLETARTATARDQLSRVL